jgi:serine protease inhibitor
MYFNIFQTTSVEAGKFMNVVISPFSVWTVLLLLREGSGGKTLSQLQKALHLHENNQAIRAAFRKLNHVVHVCTLNDLFCNMDI